jgi:streptogramin lyase
MKGTCSAGFATSLLVGPETNSDSVELAAAYPPTAWTVASDSAWLQIVTPAGLEGSGNAIITFNVSAQPAGGNTQAGHITVARGDGNQTGALTITQAGAAYTYSTFAAANPPVSAVVYSSSAGVAVDSAGNVYESDLFNDCVFQTLPDGTINTLPTVVTPTGTWGSPGELCVDPLTSDVYVIDSVNNAIDLWEPGSTNLNTVLSSNQSQALGIGALGGVAARAGAIYFSDSQNGVIYEMYPDGSVASLASQTTLGSPLMNPLGLAVDTLNNVYVADSGNNAVEEWSPGASTVVPLVSSGLYSPSAVAVDDQGNVYIADGENYAIETWLPSTGQMTTTLQTPGSQPAGVAIDVEGNIYFNWNQGTVAELAYAFVNVTPITLPPWAQTFSNLLVLPSDFNQYQYPFTAPSWLPLVQGTDLEGMITSSTVTQTGEIDVFSAQIPVTAIGGYNLLTIAATPTSLALSFVGTPGAVYVIQAAPCVAGPWSVLTGNLTADVNGMIQYNDPISGNAATRFYRAEYVSGP